MKPQETTERIRKVEKMEVEQLLVEIKNAQDEMQKHRDERLKLLEYLGKTQDLINYGRAAEREASARLKYVARLHSKKASHQIDHGIYPITERK